MATPLRVLILEDQPSDAELMVHELRRAGFDPRWERAETEAQFLAGLDAAPEVILADYALPQYGALQALGRVQERGLDLPFLIVTGTIGEETAVEAMKQGAMDYILKDRLARLGPAVCNALTQAKLGEAFTRSRALAHAGPHVLLEVSDTGCGMTPAVLAHIFEPFFTTKEAGKGTGLGLATVFGIVQQSGGFIEVESRPGQGTLFRIYLPRAGASIPGAKAKPSSPGLRRGGETLLVVEDDDGVRTLASMILRSSGYTVLEARNGENGLEAFAQHNGPIHLLLTDVVMPHMDGCQLAERLTPKMASPRVILMSGYLDDAIVRHGIQEKRLPFLQKPFQADVLLAKVREVLDQPQAAAT